MEEARMQKHWLKIVAAIAALIVLVVVLMPFFVNADAFRPTIQAMLSSALGRTVALGHLSFSLFKGGLVAQDISIADDPAFGTSPFLAAKSLEIGVHILPLVFGRQVHITHLTIDAPSINLLHAANGRWNFSSLGGAAQPTSHASQQANAMPNLTVGELKIKNGTATVSSVPAVRKPFVYSEIDLTVQQFSFLKSFPFDLSAKLPASGSLDLSGNAGPLSSNNTAQTPFQAKLALSSFDPVAAGVLDPGAGISMKVDIDSQLASDGTSLVSHGTIKADRLQLARTGSPAPHPVDIDYNVTDQLSDETGKVSSIAIHAGGVAAQVTGTYQITPQSPVLDLHLAAPNLPIDQVEQLLPAFGVRLPTGSRLSGGSLTANLTVTGPAATTTITGPVEIDNTTLNGFDIGSKIQGLNLFKGGGGTQIQTLRASVNSSPQVTQINNIYGNLPQLGSATGNGTVAPSGAIDFKLTATLNSSNAVGSMTNQALNAVSGIGGLLHRSAKPEANNNKGIPLTITGTASNPSIHASLASMLR
jgi:AsmA protein